MNDKVKFWLSKRARDFFGVSSELRTTLAHKEILENLKEQLPLKILDFGCGEGELTKKIADLGHQVVGSDISQKTLRKAKERYKAINNLSFCSIDEIKGNDFDLIILSFVMITVPNEKQCASVLEFINNKLKSNGELLFVETHPCFRQYH